MRVQRILDSGQNPKILLVEQTSAAQGYFDELDAGIGQLHIPSKLIKRVVDAGTKVCHHLVNAVCEHGIFGDSTRDN
jgi:hypothetical protein